MKIPYALAAVVALTGCLPYQGFYKSGVAVGRLNSDLTDCEVAGVNRVPANTQVRTTPITYSPVREVCPDDGGRCRYVGGAIRGGDTYTYDANADLRERFVAQCMGGKGYQRVELPACTGQAARRARVTRQSVLPRLDRSLCAFKGSDGGWVFLPRG